MKTIFIILLLQFSIIECFAPPPEKTPSENQFNYLSFKLQQTKTRLLNSQIQVESNGNPKAFNKPENAAGILQIRPIMIRHVNYLLKKQGSTRKYTLSDRMNPKKSIEIWIIVMEVHNPDYNIRQGCIIWNGRGKSGQGSEKYYQKVKSNI